MQAEASGRPGDVSVRLGENELDVLALVAREAREGVGYRGPVLDVEGALDYSRKAKTWTWVAFGFGLAGGIIYVLLSIAGGMADM